ncbi:MAG TPA: protoporphyrinogen oxidase, partial [Planctomycetaceae bacterium]|nr:protoporphyrinogen oxidase [Planctomycetaceae bacterium]
MNQSSSAIRIAVVGGGITGLSAAFHLQELAQEKKQSVEITLFESQAEAGGWIGTINQDGYRIDTGADM